MYAEPRITTAHVLLMAGLLLLGYLLGNVLLLVFAAVVMAVGLDGLARNVAGRLRLSRGWALAGVMSGVAVVIFGALGVSATRLVQQFRDLGQTLVDFAGRVQVWLEEWGLMALVENMEGESGGLAGAARGLAGDAMTYGMTAFGVLSSAVILVILTIFLAADPVLYRRGLVRLVPPKQRDVAQETLSAIAFALRWWFIGQFVSMFALGLTVGLGLFVVGVDLWFALAALTAILTLIPFLGPLIATLPIVAVGFTEGIQTGLIVSVGYAVIQNLEGNVLGPLIQQKAVNLAPALLISVQVMLSLIFGVLGLILAAPLTIVAMVLVQKLWVEHSLGEKRT